jgi:16S rRNA (adenine1518-N6/adenine1519-N6)-dimethyltransferase
MNLRAKKSLGQHFLNSKHVLGQIITAAHLTKGETVLEIGPGTGVLTEALLEDGVTVIAIEKDHRAIELLRTKFEVATQNGRLKVIEGDVLDAKLFEKESPNGSTVKLLNSSYAIVANIPYYITGAILEKFLAHEPRPQHMTLLVQKEVAERIVEGKESILSISVKAFGTPKLIAVVPRDAFTPPPNVDSAILSIEGISDKYFIDNNVDISRFFEIVRAGFVHKRKYLIRNLEAVMDHEKIKSIWQNLNLGPKIRAEDVNMNQWFGISRP